ncbi:MAG: 1-acyl-sn-glycerol-3-phosphate acyltransferase [Anaerolineales bacterium]|nr:1-acyl-sn-glycerol-3-phosphate acyltransferase [Anaerolineales bacterium]
MTEVFTVSRVQTLKRRVLRMVIQVIFKLLFKVKISGLEHVPVGEAYVIASNHVSHYEPPLLMSFWPEIPEALAGHDVWDRRYTGIFPRIFGAIPVRRGEYDRQVIETTINVLTSGRPVLIAPEGGRSNTPGMRRAKPGIAYLIDRAKVPVLPVAILGTRNDSLNQALKFKRPVLEMRIGEPFIIPEIGGKGEERREARQRWADEIMLRIASMLPEEYHGVYAGQVKSYPES